MSTPHIVSRVNGMKIDLPPGQAGILHRFTNPENRLVVASVHAEGSTAQEPEKLVVPGTPEGESLTPRKPKTAQAQEVVL